MIKVTIPEKKQSLDFPMLMERKATGLIILATSVNTRESSLTGTVIKIKDDLNRIGYWCTAWKETDFEPYTGTVTLENQETA